MEELQREIHSKESDLRLSDLCDPLTADEIHKNHQTLPCRKFFTVPDTLFQCVAQLHKLDESTLFLRLTKCLIGKRALAIDEIAPVLHRAFEEISAIAQKLKIGSILFSELDQLFGYLKRHYTRMEKEMKILASFTGLIGWVDGCLVKIRKYHQLDQYHRGAQIMQEVRTSFQLKGDFALLDQLTKAVSVLLQSSKLPALVQI